MVVAEVILDFAMNKQAPLRAGGIRSGIWAGLTAVLFWVLQFNCAAQWVTQSIDLHPGWNAVFLHVDLSHTDLKFVQNDASSPIMEIWMWRPAPSTIQFFQDPQDPVGTGTQWGFWQRSTPANATLSSLVGDSAYLVFVAGTSNYTWNLLGKPVVPGNRWSGDGQNLIGFSTPSANAPALDAFFSPVPEFRRGLEVYHYPGGESGSPQTERVFPFMFSSKKLVRGQAFWMRNLDTFNRYSGAFDLALASRSGINFGESGGQTSFRIRNQTKAAVTVTVKLLASEAAPSGQTSIAGTPPLLIRGALNTTNLSYGYTSLNQGGSFQWTLSAAGSLGSDVEVVLGVNRAAMSGAEGALFGGLLQFTDSLGYSQLDVPVSAKITSSAGLWVGNAAVSHVGHYLHKYAKATNETHMAAILTSLGRSNGNGTNYVLDAGTGLIIVQTATSGAYLSTNLVTDSGAVVRPATLRLIVHNPTGAANARLLQQVFYGADKSSNTVVSTTQSALHPDLLSYARRITAPHLPWTPSNQSWAFNGRLRSSGGITTEVVTGYDDQASNPFLHTYHPDHDNLDATFSSKLPLGQESFEIRRSLTLTSTPPLDDFKSLTSSGGVLSGTYVETITLVGAENTKGGNDQRQFVSSGVFSLNRISDVGTLTTSP